METMELYSIYKLSDPRDTKVRYVGLNKQPYQRYGQHLALMDSNIAKNAWIAEMSQEGFLPQLEIIEQVNGQVLAKNREAYWIEEYIELGMPLTNISLNTNSHRNAVLNYPLEQISLSLQTLQATNEQLQRQVEDLQETVTALRRHVKVSPSKPAQLTAEKIVSRLKKVTSATPRELAAFIHTDVATIREALQILEDEGYVEKELTKKSIRYRCTGN